MAQVGSQDVGRDAPVPECGWYRTLAPPPPADVVRGTLRVDMAVVGAGFTGLACARRLAELNPGATIALIEAGRIGRANSGRNSGFLLDVSFYDDAPAAVHAARNRLQRGGLTELARVVSAHGLDCDWRPWGNLYGAITAREEGCLAEVAAKHAAAGEPLEDWPAERMAAVTGSARYRRGVFHPGSVLVQPVRLVRGLAASPPEDVRLFEESGVTALRRRAGGVELETAAGRVIAEQVFLCANGGTPALGQGRRRLLGVSTFAAMTPPLEGQAGPISGAEAFGLLPSLSGGATLRKTADQRLLVRQSVAFTPRGGPAAADSARFLAQARETVRQRWPELAAVPFDFAWSGVMALTRNTARLFGRVDDRLYVAAFCNGAGNTSGTMAGRLLAELAAGEDSELLADQMALPRPQWLPPAPLCRFVVNRRIRAAERRLAEVYAGA